MATYTNDGMSVTMSGETAAQQVRDGGFIVQVPAAGATISSMSGVTMSYLNLPGNLDTPAHEAALLAPHTESTPTTVYPGDVLIVATTAGGARSTFSNVPAGSSPWKHMMAINFVSWAPHTDSFRPPALGNGPLVRWLRSLEYRESSVSSSQVTSTIDPANAAFTAQYGQWGHAEPTVAVLLPLLQKFCGEIWGGWATHFFSPTLQNIGYGIAQQYTLSKALLRLHSTDLWTTKEPLAYAIVQRGIDLLGAFADGRYNYASGGHMAGQKAMILAAIKLLNLPFDIRTIFPSKVFQEDWAYEAGTWWFGGSPNWDAVWNFQRGSPTDTGAGYGTINCPLDPSSWGKPTQHTNTGSSWSWMISSYMPQVLGASVGIALAMRLWGLEAQMGSSLDSLVEDWMSDWPDIAKSALANANVPIWNVAQKDFSEDGGLGFCEVAWGLYA